MLNYGGSITSAFPNTFCSSPASLTCQLCNTCIGETSSSASSSSAAHTISSSALGGSGGGVGSPGGVVVSGLSTGGSGQGGGGGVGGSATGVGGNLSSTGTMMMSSNRLEKCTHCGINICERCFNENHECASSEQHGEHGMMMNGSGKGVAATAHSHYNTVKKEFKQMYNYSKEIVEKLHLLNNTIKMEESAVSELNLIKHQVNTKAIELIKQINQEKCDLIEQIENVKRKYESYVFFIYFNNLYNFEINPFKTNLLGFFKKLRKFNIFSTSSYNRCFFKIIFK